MPDYVVNRNNCAAFCIVGLNVAGVLQPNSRSSLRPTVLCNDPIWTGRRELREIATMRYLERWNAGRKKAPLKQLGVDEIHLGKKTKFLTVASNLETAELLWFGRERKTETLDEFFEGELSAGQRSRIESACVDMWEPFRKSIQRWAPRCMIVYDKFHVMQHANQAVDEVRRAEFFRQGGKQREVAEIGNSAMHDSVKGAWRAPFCHTRNGV